MGDPRKVRKKFETPGHPWIGSRIEEERAIVREFGLRNKREVWKMGTMLKQFKDRAKRLLALTTDQARTEEQQLLHRLERLGLIAKGAGFDEILGLDLRDLLNRRLQTILLKKNLARTLKQARQMITHRHVKVDGKVITSPSYLVTLAEEATVEFANRSAFFNESHPERFSEEELQRKQVKEDAKKEDAKKEDAKKEAKKEDAEDAAAFDEKSIEKAEVLVGEKKVEKKLSADENKPADSTPEKERKEKKPAKATKADSKNESKKSAEKPAEKEPASSEKKPVEAKVEEGSEKKTDKVLKKEDSPKPAEKKEDDA